MPNTFRATALFARHVPGMESVALSREWCNISLRANRQKVRGNTHHAVNNLSTGGMKMSKLTIVARIVAKGPSVEDVKLELLKMIEPTRKEGGCLDYYLHQDNENPEVFIFYENWKNEEELNNHMGTDHFKALVAAIGSITEEITIQKLTQL
jgi:quinol monooxygenase YgiN